MITSAPIHVSFELTPYEEFKRVWVCSYHKTEDILSSFLTTLQSQLGTATIPGAASFSDVHLHVNKLSAPLVRQLSKTMTMHCFFDIRYSMIYTPQKYRVFYDYDKQETVIHWYDVSPAFLKFLA